MGGIQILGSIHLTLMRDMQGRCQITFLGLDETDSLIMCQNLPPICSGPCVTCRKGRMMCKVLGIGGSEPRMAGSN
jgi:hypothetical protein